jgi:hypothetical protein
MVCKWCGNDDGCDCITRMECMKAGAIGHRFCGIHSCGCPKFTHLEGKCEKMITKSTNTDAVTKRERRAYVEGLLEGIKLYSFINTTGKLVIGREERPIREALDQAALSLEEWINEGLE